MHSLYLKGGSIVLLSLLFCLPADSRQPSTFCGTQKGNVQEQIARYRRGLTLRSKLRAASTPVGRDYGNIAVMYDSAGVVTARNTYNLASTKVRLTRSGAGYKIETTATDFSQTEASDGQPLDGLQDDDTRRFDLPFSFPFYAKTHRAMFVNSDGNVTFEQGDAIPSVKTIGLLAGGPPRIAPMIVDLDPTRVTRGAVRLNLKQDRVIVTWFEVPEWTEFGTGPLQSFQLRLFVDGTIEFAYSDNTVREAVVGIAPGNASGETAVIAFANPPSTEFTGAIAERFSFNQAIDTVLLSQRFYQTHEDSYDILAVYNTLGIVPQSGVLANQLTIRSRFRAGFGDRELDVGHLWGSSSRLQSFLNMGALDDYPRSPRATVPGRFPSQDTPLSVLAHETGHLFLALASIRDPNNPRARPMLTSDFAHWNFNFNSEASMMSGNRIRDNGEAIAPRFVTTGHVEQYAPLDQYLMGFRPPEEVPPTFLIRNSNRSADTFPQTGASISGTRQDIAVEEVIAAEGRRAPDHTVAQRRYRIAIALLMKDGTEPSLEDLQQLEILRQQFEGFYAEAAGNRSTIETILKKNLALSVWPAAGIIQGSTIQATVRVDRPAEANLAVILRTQNGAIETPASVTIPAGATEATFAVRGLRSGVEELTAETADASYRSDNARVQVNSSLSNLRLQLLTNEDPLIEVRVTDINLIPYPGIRLTVSNADNVTSGPDGIARIPYSGNDIRVTIDGSDVSIAAPGIPRPAFTSSGVLSAASYEAGLAPGSLGVVFGINFTEQTQQATALPWPTSLAGVQVLMNGVPAPIYFASNGQINFFVPANLAGNSVQMLLRGPAGISQPVQVPLATVLPGLFFNATTEEAAALVAGTGQLTSDRAIKPGEFLEIYGTGFGQVQAAASGLQETIAKPRVLLNGVDTEVVFSGLPGAVPGLYQINARVPETMPEGRAELRIETGGRRSNAAWVMIGK